jgi:hypothetical protein
MKSHAQTPAEGRPGHGRAGFPGQDADQARQKKVVPFGGAIKSHSYLKDVEQPSYLQRPALRLKRRPTPHQLRRECWIPPS